MVITVVAMRMMQSPVNQIIHMISVGNGGMTAIRAVDMFRRSFLRGKLRRALLRVRRADFYDMLVDMIPVRMVEMAVIQIVHMTIVLDRYVTTVGAVNVRMVSVFSAAG